MNNARTFRTSEIREVVCKFEACEFSPQEFHHRDHLTVIACYLEELPVRAALERIRTALKKFTAYHKAKGYNETITRFWVAKVTQIMASEGDDPPLPEIIERIHTVLGNKELVFEYYSRERVLSEGAKHGWLEPDRKGL